MKKKTHEEYVEELNVKNPTVEVIGKYVGSRMKIKHKCLIANCGYEWTATPHDLLAGSGCPKCAGNIKRTHDEFINDMLHINPNIEIISHYVNSVSKIKCRCLVDGCGHIWEARASHLLHGHGCPKCAHKILGKSKTLSNDEFIKKIHDSDKKIELLSPYINATTKIKYRCLKDGYIGYALPHNLLKDNCPRCSKSERYSTIDFKNKILSMNPDILVIGKYINSTTKVECLCLRDGHKWMAEPRLLLKGSGCPQCYETQGEQRIRLWLERHKIAFDFQKRVEGCRDIRTLPFDFFLPEHTLIIEYHGRQHYEAVDFSGSGKESATKQLDITQRHDAIKRQYCLDNNIELLEIPYWENVENTLNNFLFN